MQNSNIIKNYIRLLRPGQYIKNLFIFLPLFFSAKMGHCDLLAKNLASFIAFCLIASAVYILNDLGDVDDDKRHPVKRFRPLASGHILPGQAIKVMASLLIAGFALSTYISSLLNSYLLLLILSFYLLLNILYTVKLKHVAILDVTVIAIGFILRLFTGSITSGIPLSMWIILITFLLALFLSLAKRRDDVLIFQENAQKTRKNIDGYNLEFINAAMVVMASLTVMSYIMYTISSDVIARIKSDRLYLTTGFVVVGIMRYMQVTFVEQNSGSPTKVLGRDRFLQLVILGWIISFIFILY